MSNYKVIPRHDPMSPARSGFYVHTWDEAGEAAGEAVAGPFGSTVEADEEIERLEAVAAAPYVCEDWQPQDGGDLA